MSDNEYDNVKITKVKMKSLKEALHKKGIKPRSKAEAVNTVIDKFLIETN